MSKPDTFDLAAGTTQFYADPTYYDYEYKDRRADIRWYTSLYAQMDGPVLELGVGTGRVAIPAVRAGARVVGLDLDARMLAAAEAHRQKVRKDRRDRLTLVQGDMRDFALGQRFAMVSCPFNAFMHLYTREDVERCLACVRAHLEPGGVFALDVLMPDLEYLLRSPYKRFQGIRFKHPTYKVHYTYSEQSAYDPIRQLNQMWFIYDRDPQVGAPPPGQPTPPERVELQLSHRYFFPEELSALLHYNGFEILTRNGDFEHGAPSGDCESMVLTCTQRG